LSETTVYLVVITIGTLATLIVGQVLMRSGQAFLRDVFADDEVATSTTRLLSVLFHLVALGFLALISTWDPFQIPGVVQTIITKLGGVLLVLGILHGGTLLVLARVRNRRRAQGIEESMTQQYDQQRRARQSGGRAQVIEAGGSNPGGSNRN
jgi:hypothetical protein